MSANKRFEQDMEGEMLDEKIIECDRLHERIAALQAEVLALKALGEQPPPAMVQAEVYDKCFNAAFDALQKLNSVRFMWNGPIHQAAALLRGVTEPQQPLPAPPLVALSGKE